MLLCAGVEDPRLTAEEMDIQRQENIAYEYLCHLEEAKVYVDFSWFLAMSPSCSHVQQADIANLDMISVLKFSYT